MTDKYENKIAFQLQNTIHLKENSTLNLVNRFRNVCLRIFKSFNCILSLLHFEFVLNFIAVMSVREFSRCFPFGDALILNRWWKLLLDNWTTFSICLWIIHFKRIRLKCSRFVQLNNCQRNVSEKNTLHQIRIIRTRMCFVRLSSVIVFGF